MSDILKIVESSEIGESVERSMTPAEKSEYQKDVKRINDLKAAEIAAEQAKIDFKINILKKLGLSAEDAQTFLE